MALQPVQKEHLSDDELSPSVMTSSPISRSLVKVPDDEGDEFLFRRLGKQLKGHWQKLLDRYPQGFFHSRHQTENAADGSPESIASIISAEPEEISLPVKAAKSALFLPHFGIQKSDDSRPVVPFICDLLQVKGGKKLLVSLFIAAPLDSR